MDFTNDRDPKPGRPGREPHAPTLPPERHGMEVDDGGTPPEPTPDGPEPLDSGKAPVIDRHR